jgi:hypothetical protein
MGNNIARVTSKNPDQDNQMAELGLHGVHNGFL